MFYFECIVIKMYYFPIFFTQTEKIRGTEETGKLYSDSTLDLENSTETEGKERKGKEEET